MATETQIWKGRALGREDCTKIWDLVLGDVDKNVKEPPYPLVRQITHAFGYPLH